MWWIIDHQSAKRNHFKFCSNSESWSRTWCLFQHVKSALNKFGEEADYHLVSVRSPIHHVWSQFTQLKHSGWGHSATRNTKFVRSSDTPESDLVDFDLWLDYFITDKGTFSKDHCRRGYTGYNLSNIQARHLTSH